MNKRLLMIACFLVCVWVLTAQAWDAPKHWSEIGTVSQWDRQDQRFYRSYNESRTYDTSQFKINQVREYNKTREHADQWPAVTLGEFLALSDSEQTARVDRARKALKFVTRFHDRIGEQVQLTQENRASGWGNGVRDVTVLGDCLRQLGTATGLDPTNPYAWHLQAYLAGTVGDNERCLFALTGAQQALDRLPADQLTDMRRRVYLDMAWLHRNLGEFDQVAVYADMAETLTKPDTESTLLRGLAAALSGDIDGALKYANAVGSVPVRKFPFKPRSSDFGPELKNVQAWKESPSGYMRAWISALAWLKQNEPAMAASAFSDFSHDDAYQFGRQFWNDAGYIYEATGRAEVSAKAWTLARLYAPYEPYFVFKPYGLDLDALTGNETGHPDTVFLGFDSFYLAGSRLAFGALLAGNVNDTEDESERRELAFDALEQLELCVMQGQHPGAASVIQGHLYYVLGDYESAALELEGAMAYYKDAGNMKGHALATADLERVRSKQGRPGAVDALSQSGVSQGRWATPADPIIAVDELRQAWQDTPSDVTRRAFAQFLIRNDRLDEGLRLAVGDHADPAASTEVLAALPAEDLTLVLEAHRKQGKIDLALYLIDRLASDTDSGLDDPGLWAMAGFICLENGANESAKLALEKAVELDPTNQGLQRQLLVMGG